MDAFQHTLLLEKIDTLKTYKAKEELVRELAAMAGDYQRYGATKSTTEKIHFVRTSTKLLKVYRDVNELDRLPRKLTQRLNTVFNYLIQEIDNDSELQYKDLMYVTEFNKVLPALVINSSKIVLALEDNPHDLIFNTIIQVPSKYSGTSRSSPLLNALVLQEYRRTLDQSKTYTVLNDEITAQTNTIDGNFIEEYEESLASTHISLDQIKEDIRNG